MLKYSARHRGFVDQEKTWKKIIALYAAGEMTITDIAKRFGFTHAGIRYGLKQRKLLRERKTKCGLNASAN